MTEHPMPVHQVGPTAEQGVIEGGVAFQQASEARREYSAPTIGDSHGHLQTELVRLVRRQTRTTWRCKHTLLPEAMSQAAWWIEHRLAPMKGQVEDITVFPLMGGWTVMINFVEDEAWPKEPGLERPRD